VDLSENGGGSPISMTQLKRKMLIDSQIWQVYSSISYIVVYRVFSDKHTYTTTSTDLQDFFEPRFWMFDTPLKKFSARHWAAVTFQGQPQPKPIAMQQRCPVAILQDHIDIIYIYIYYIIYIYYTIYNYIYIILYTFFIYDIYIYIFYYILFLF